MSAVVPTPGAGESVPGEVPGGWNRLTWRRRIQDSEVGDSIHCGILPRRLPAGPAATRVGRRTALASGVLLTCLLVPTPAARAASKPAPPAAVTDRIGESFHVFDRGGRPLAYTLTVRSTVSKLDGSDREESESVERVTRAADGTTTFRVVRASEKGRDVTADAQRQRNERAAKREAQQSEGKKEIKVGLGLPAGEDAAKYAFEPATREGGLQVTAFRPRPDHRGDDDVSRGRLAWDPATSDPVWIEVVPVKLPRGASELGIRVEFARAGELVYPSRTVTDGVGGILWIKRRFHAEVEVSGLETPPSESQKSPASD